MELVRPSMHYLDSYRAAVLEFQEEGRMLKVDVNDLEHYIQFLLDMETDPLPGKVPETYYWLVDGDEFIGRVSIRHQLTEPMKLIGGHIGYEIRPSQREKGYGRLILKLVLDEVRKFGFQRVLLTCNATNEASRRIIMANGGEFQDEISVIGHPVNVQRWWITL